MDKERDGRMNKDKEGGGGLDQEEDGLMNNEGEG